MLMASIGDRYPVERLDDLVLFTLMFLLIALVSFAGHWDLVSNLSSALLGAITMYIRADKSQAMKPRVDLPITGSTTTQITTTEQASGTSAGKPE